MKITTPLGDYDYRIDRVAVRDGRLEVDGRLGEWDTKMIVERSDIIELAKRAAPLLGLLSAAALVTWRQKRG